MFTLFGALALAMSAIGLYGAAAYAVARRARELGIRAALGARRADVVRLVVGEGLRVSLAGLAVGGLAAFAGGRFLASLLFGTTAADPGVYVAAGATLAAASILAALIPALRASRVDPSVVLRAE